MSTKGNTKESTKIFQAYLSTQLIAHKQKIAIEYGARTISYARLDRLTAQLAVGLLDRGLSGEIFIGVYCSDRVHLILSMMGILKARCVFVPLDPALPLRRLQTMMETAHIKYLIYADADDIVAALLNEGVQGLKLDSLCPDIAGCGDEIESQGDYQSLPDGVTYTGDDRIYVYFTSGTSGTPRAIVGKNKSLRHFINWEIETFDLTEGCRVSQWITPGFDAFLRDVFTPLCCGGTLCIPEVVLTEPEAMAVWLEEQRIHLVHCVPSLFAVLNRAALQRTDFEYLRFVLMSGESIDTRVLKQWYDVFGNRVQLVNLYGPSETTMIKTFYLLSPDDLEKERIPVGKPMKGARIIILDENLSVCEPQVIGEIYIRTPFAAHGYYNDPLLNREKFIVNPLSNDPLDLVFKTGDLGRLDGEGNIIFLGRKDRQVKLNGVRVELEEIECVLKQHEAVVRAAVVLDDSRRLCAALTMGREGDGVSVSELKNFLMQKLPLYMVPALFKVLDVFPLKPNGKVDYQSLAAAFAAPAEERFRAPENEVQVRLVSLWEEVLGLDGFGVDSGFFQLGGNSLHVLTLISLIQREFDIKITLADFFNNDTVAKLARLLHGSGTTGSGTIGSGDRGFGGLEDIPRAAVLPFYPVSSVQRRLFFLQQLDAGNTGYNITLTVVLEGNYDIHLIESVLRRLLKRHESLRTTFALKGEEPVQVIHDDLEFAVQTLAPPVDLLDREALNKLIHAFVQPFFLDRGPLFRVGVVESGATDGVRSLFLVLDIHHIIFDGTSQWRFVSEFMSLYSGEELELPGLQYKDYSQWRNRPDQVLKIKQQGDYWLERLAGPLTLLNLPNDFPRPTSQGFAGGGVVFLIDRVRLQQLKQRALEAEATLFMVLLAVFNVFLARITGEEEIIVGTSVSGRVHPDLAGVIGMFVNALPMRNFPKAVLSFRQFTAEVRENTLRDFQNQEFGFEDLVGQLNRPRIPGRNPVFDVMMVLNNEAAPELKLPDVTIRGFEMEKSAAQMDLKLRMTEGEQGLHCLLEYSSALFMRETVEMFAANFKETVGLVSADPDVTLGRIRLAHGLAATNIDTSQMDFDF